MSLHDDLLAQAWHLAEVDPRRPKQANLRRAVSAAYYALFHLFVAEAVQRMVPARPSHLANKMSRAFSHGEMKQVCNLFRAYPTGRKLLSLLNAPVSSDLRVLANSFVELQETRHSADYDPSLRLFRTEALEAIERAETAFRLWRLIREAEEANAFLACLAFGARWDR